MGWVQWMRVMDGIYTVVGMNAVGEMDGRGAMAEMDWMDGMDAMDGMGAMDGMDANTCPYQESFGSHSNCVAQGAVGRLGEGVSLVGLGDVLP